jgi:hypothetical protein
VDEVEVMVVKIGLELVAPALQQRTNERLMARVHGCEPPRPGTPKKPQQECLCLIVPRMPQRNHVRVGLQTRALEKRVSGRTRGVLDRPAFAASQRSNVPGVGHERSIERVGNLGAELLLGISGRTELVVEMCKGDETELAGGIKRAQQMRKRDRI